LKTTTFNQKSFQNLDLIDPTQSNSVKCGLGWIGFNKKNAETKSNPTWYLFSKLTFVRILPNPTRKHPLYI